MDTKLHAFLTEPFTILMSSIGLSFLSVSTNPILLTIAIPEWTLPVEQIFQNRYVVHDYHNYKYIYIYIYIYMYMYVCMYDSDLPNIVCFPSSHWVGASVIKNCDPFVFGPEFAIDNIPAPITNIQEY
jgi:hypothetical protein